MTARFALLLGIAVAVLFAASPAAADEGWSVQSFAADIAVTDSGDLDITETIAVDFGALQKHGILREIPVRYRYDDTHARLYELTVRSVTDPQGKPYTYTTSSQGANVVVKVGDANRTVSGQLTYVIAYAVRGALNGFKDHDELYWNVNGVWPVPTSKTSAKVRLGHGAFDRAVCYQGKLGSNAKCAASAAGQSAEFSSTHALAAEEQVTVLLSLPKGTVAAPSPILVDSPRGFAEFFETDPIRLGAALLVLLAGLGVVGATWWTAGRDRPDRVTIVAEYEPPEHLHPAHLGLLIDESVDQRDLAATIIDLAVHGYLAIDDVSDPQGHRVGVKYTKRNADPAKLYPYEQQLYAAMFADGDEVTTQTLAMSPAFRKARDGARRDLYAAAVRRDWFPDAPDHIRDRWRGHGRNAIILAFLAMFALGQFGAGLAGLALIPVGIAMIVTSGAMPRRTKAGAELARRTLGFKQYMDVAEKQRMEFAAREKIFATYLPYAIAFGNVAAWAKAFTPAEIAAGTQDWYQGQPITTQDDVGRFSQGVATSGYVDQAFATVSTEGGSGQSGFSSDGSSDSGSSGGGGGGGGGGSW